jgi:hypothetical protein
VYAAYEVADFDYDEYNHDEADSYDYVLIANRQPFVYRNFGSNRYETAFKAAQLMHEDTGDFKAVIVTSGENFADALAGSYLAAKVEAPILLTDNDKYTMPIMVSLLRGDIYKVEHGAIYLGLTLSVLPLFIVYFCLSKYIIAGVALGGVKG